MQPDPEPLRALVVGGGVAGLVAARELAARGVAVALFEAANYCGGRIAGVQVDGVNFDLGAEAFATRGGAVAELVEELGIGHRIVAPASHGSWLVTPSGATPMPASGTMGIPVAPFSPATRRVLGIPGAARAAAEACLPRVRRRPASDTTLAELVRARLGHRVLERLVRPVALGVYSRRPEEIRIDEVPGLAAEIRRAGSLRAAAGALRRSTSAAGGAVSGLRGGMSDLIGALIGDIERRGGRITTGTTVAATEFVAGHGAPDEVGGAGGEWILRGGSGDELARAELLVLAVPRAEAARMLGDGAAGISSRAGAPETEVEVVLLVIDDERLDAAPRGTGALVAGAPHGGIRAKALTHVTAKWPLRAQELPAGRHALRLSYGSLQHAPATAGLGDDDAYALALADASRILGVALDPSKVRGQARQRWRIPPAPRRRGAAAGPGSGAGSGPGTLALVGDSVHGTGLASVVPAARAAAGDLLRAHAGSRGTRREGTRVDDPQHEEPQDEGRKTT